MGEQQIVTEATGVQEKSRLKGSLLVGFSAVGFGLMPLFAKYAYTAGATPLTFLFLRFLMAAVILTCVVFIKGENLRLPLKQFLYLVALGIGGYSAVSGCYFFAITKIPASITSLLLYTYPILVTIIAVLLGDEKIERRKNVALVISFAGIVLILDSSIGGLNMVGVALAVGSALFYSLYIIFSNKMLKSLSPLVTSTFIIWSAAFALGTAAFLTGSFKLGFGPVGWGAIVGITLVSTVGGILTFQMGLGLIGPSQASIISTLEPLVTVLSAFIFFGEVLTVIQIIGGGLVLIAAVLLQLPRKEHNSKYSENIL